MVIYLADSKVHNSYMQTLDARLKYQFVSTYFGRLECIPDEANETKVCNTDLRLIFETTIMMHTLRQHLLKCQLIECPK